MSLKNTNEEILVVDDDEAIRWMLREALQSWGFVPVEAASVADALKHFKADVPAAVCGPLGPGTGHRSCHAAICSALTENAATSVGLSP